MYEEPKLFDEIDFMKLSSLQYSTAFGKPWNEEQKAVELELDTRLETLPQKSIYGT